jgi:hypothetical protein
MNIQIKSGIAVLVLLCPFHIMSAEDNDSLIVVPTDTINIYTGKIVSDEKRVMSKQTLQMSNTTITGSGHLKATAEDGIVIIDETTVMLGGTLQLNGASQYAIKYYYDASGNRTNRRKDTRVK